MFEGEVSGVIAAGAFVRFAGELGDVYEGFLPARRMGAASASTSNETETAIVGRRSGRRVRLGDPVVGPRRRGRGGPRAASTSSRRRRAERSVSKRGKRKAASGDVATNRRASHTYELIERFECGIELLGSEVKSLREGKSQIGDAYAVDRGGRGLAAQRPHPALRRRRAPPNHDPERPRKLLLHRYEIERLIGRMRAQGPDPGPDPDLLQGPAGEGRAGPGARQGAARPPQRDPRPRHPARDRARAARPPAVAALRALSA